MRQARHGVYLTGGLRPGPIAHSLCVLGQIISSLLASVSSEAKWDKECPYLIGLL